MHQRQRQGVRDSTAAEYTRRRGAVASERRLSAKSEPYVTLGLCSGGESGYAA
jgi:hypothetical protein